MSRLLRVCGRSYSSEDLKYIGQQYCNKNNLKFYTTEINPYLNSLMIRCYEKGNKEELKKNIPFHELKSYKLITREGEKPYFEDNRGCFYRDELEEAARHFSKYSCVKYVKFKISHQKDCLVVYCMNGILPDKLEIPLYKVDEYLQSGNSLFKKPYA